MATASDRISALRARFVEVHRHDDVFVLPNPWDVGSARILQALGFVALATTSSGFAASLGRSDQHVSLDELAAHVRAIVDAVDLPLNIDAERGFADDIAGVRDSYGVLADTGAAGASIEDWDPVAGRLDDIDTAASRVAAAAGVLHEHGMVLTARAENHLHGVTDIDDTLARLRAYRDAGADCVYAPGLADLAVIERVVKEVGLPVNVLALPGGPTVAQLGGIGVRRVSTGGSLAWAAYGALVAAARELLGAGTSTYLSGALPGDIRRRAFTS